jgi:hypothetical protein
VHNMIVLESYLAQPVDILLLLPERRAEIPRL